MPVPLPVRGMLLFIRRLPLPLRVIAAALVFGITGALAGLAWLVGRLSNLFKGKRRVGRMLTLEDIQKGSPEVSMLGGGQWAFYGASCCWWTTWPEDMAVVPGTQIPCCPHCGSLLMMAPLSTILEVSQGDPGRYGPGGLASLVKAHHRGGDGVHYQSWDEVPIEGGGES